MRITVITLFFFVSSFSFGQNKTVINEDIVWLQYNLKSKLNENYGASFASQYRNFLDRENGYHLFFTVGISRKLAHGFSFGVGVTNLNINRFVETDYVLVPEIRPYQSLVFGQQLGKSRFSWKFMVEERFFRNVGAGELVRGFNSNWRFRNKAAYQQFLSAKWGLTLSSEVMFNAGSNIDLNLFDQHRAQFLVNYKLESAMIQLGYMHWFVQTAGNRHENRHSLVMSFAHSI